MRYCYFLLLMLIVTSAKLLSQAKYEPDSSCYIGAFIVYDPAANGNVSLFEQLTSKKHSMYFNYTGYGSAFPSSWVADYASKGAAVQIAFEPNGGLNEVTDGDYIREWARAAQKTGAAIFLRWACEMNGSWVAWYGNPSLYKEKFKLIHDIMKEEAPNVTMVWAPNNIPNDLASINDNIYSYYPGDEYVDWVGIDFYGVYVSDNGTPEREDPRNKLRVVYDTYAKLKPIMICEWAAAHYTYRLTPFLSISSYAVAQMDSLYLNIQNQFPRLKAVNWFSVNSQNSNKCNFSLTDDITVLNNYKKDIYPSYFRTEPYLNVPFVEFDGITADTVLHKDLSFNAKVKCDAAIDSVVFYLDKKRINKLTQIPYNFNLTVNDLQDGSHLVKTVAYAKSGYYNFGAANILIDKTNQYSNQIIDDNSTSVSFNGAWTFSNSQPDRYGTGYHYAAAGDGSAKAIWKLNTPGAGYYNVYAWWSEHENRASNAPYIIMHKNISDTIRVNQKTNGGKWNYLGRYYFEQGETGSVTLTNQADGIVIADAVRLEWAFPLSAPQPLHAENFQLLQNYPNPFNPSTIITYKIKIKTNVELKIYDALGRLTATLVNEEKEAGTYNIEFNTARLKKSSLSSGVYYCILKAGNYTETKKMMLQK